MGKPSSILKELVIRDDNERDLAETTQMKIAFNEREGIDEAFSQYMFEEDVYNGHAQPRPISYVAELNKQLVGYIFGYPGINPDNQEKVIYINEIFVYKDFRNLKIGTSLVAKMASESSSRGSKWLSVAVLQDGRVWRPYYEHKCVDNSDVHMAYARRVVKLTMDQLTNRSDFKKSWLSKFLSKRHRSI